MTENMNFLNKANTPPEVEIVFQKQVAFNLSGSEKEKEDNFLPSEDLKTPNHVISFGRILKKYEEKYILIRKQAKSIVESLEENGVDGRAALTYCHQQNDSKKSVASSSKLTFPLIEKAYKHIFLNDELTMLSIPLNNETMGTYCIEKFHANTNEILREDKEFQIEKQVFESFLLENTFVEDNTEKAECGAYSALLATLLENFSKLKGYIHIPGLKSLLSMNNVRGRYYIEQVLSALPFINGAILCEEILGFLKLYIAQKQENNRNLTFLKQTKCFQNLQFTAIYVLFVMITSNDMEAPVQEHIKRLLSSKVVEEKHEFDAHITKNITLHVTEITNLLSMAYLTAIKHCFLMQTAGMDLKANLLKFSYPMKSNSEIEESSEEE